MLKQSPRHSRPPAGFSLMEILIVVVITGVLSAMLLLMFGKGRASAKNLECISHLRQVAFALNGYATDHDGKFPATYGPLRTPPDRQTWMAKAAPYAGMPDKSIGNDPVPRSGGIFACPEFPREALEAREVSYRYNITVVTVWEYRRALMASSKVFLVVETEGVNTELFSILTSPDVARRHPAHSANFLYADGHVENVRHNVPSTDPRWGFTRDFR